MRKEEDNAAPLLNSKGLELKGKKSSPFIIQRDGFWAKKSRITAQY
jgi:hypothetical protein